VQFINIRELRMRAGDIWKQLEKEGYMVVTSNGKPVALLSSVEDNLDEYLQAIKRARAILAVNRLQENAVKDGRDQITEQEIEAEIRTVRRGRH